MIKDENGIWKHTKEEISKMSSAKLGKPSNRLGIPHSEESKRKLSLALKGKLATNGSFKKGSSGFVGKHTEETKKRISLAKKGMPSKKKGIKTNKPAWNRGIHTCTNTGRTQFKKGQKSWSFIDGRSKHPLCRKKINGILNSHFVYCFQPENFYRIPQGMVIHHLDGDGSNDNPKNLLMMIDRDHRVFNNLLIKQLNKQKIVI